MPLGACCLGVAIQLVPGAPVLERRSCDTYRFVDNVVAAAPGIGAGYALVSALTSAGVSQAAVTGQDCANIDMCRWEAAGNEIHR